MSRVLKEGRVCAASHLLAPQECLSLISSLGLNLPVPLPLLSHCHLCEVGFVDAYSWSRPVACSCWGAFLLFLGLLCSGWAVCLSPVSAGAPPFPASSGCHFFARLPWHLFVLLMLGWLLSNSLFVLVYWHICFQFLFLFIFCFCFSLVIASQCL